MTLTGSATGLVLLHLIQQLSGASSIYWVSGIPEFAREDFFGTLVNPNHAGILLAAVLPISAALTRRGNTLAQGVAILATALITGGIWLSGSRGALIAAVGGLGCMVLVLGSKRVRYTAAGLVLLFGLLVIWIGPQQSFVGLSALLMPESLSQDAWSLRPQIWSDTIALIERSPWFGVGMGGFESAYAIEKSNPQFTTTSHAHGEALQVIAETGIATGMLWIITLLSPMVVGWRHSQQLRSGRRQILIAGFLGGYAALLIGCLTDFPLRVGVNSILLASIAGVLLARSGSSSPPAPPSLQRALSPLVWIAAVAAMVPALALVHLETTLGNPVQASDQAWRLANESEDPVPHIEESAFIARAGLAWRPLDHALLLRLARAQVGLRDLDGALYTLSLSQRNHPTLPWSWFAAARIHSQRGELDAARHAWRSGLALDLPDSAEGLAHVEEALADAPSRPTVLAMIPARADRLRDAAIVVAKFHDRTLAMRLFEHASMLDPRVNLTLANHLLRWGDPEQAWKRVLQVPNRHCHTLRTGARALMAQKRVDEAIVWLEEALATCGAQDALTLHALAEARVRARDPDALRLVDRLIREQPEHLPLQRLRAQILRDQHRFEEMIPILENLVLQGTANAGEMNDLLRLYDGLPLR
jgi:O-antigen ligase/tetratricopeptide (TPR) repeat protein